MRILAIDLGEKQIGLAISDPTGTIANPLMIFKHQSNEKNLEVILGQVLNLQVDLIVIGQSLDEDGNPNFAGRRSQRLADYLHRKTTIPITLWDETLSTQDARKARIEMNVSRKRRQGNIDDLAAAIILQSFLENKNKDN